MAEMAFKDHFSTHAADYERYRPGYPPALFEWLAAAVPARRLALDVGTCNGQAAVGLAEYFDEVVEDGFRVERCKGATCTNFTLVAEVGPNVSTFMNTGLSQNTTYRYRVYAYNASGVSAYSNIVQAKTLKR